MSEIEAASASSETSDEVVSGSASEEDEDSSPEARKRSPAAEKRKKKKKKVCSLNVWASRMNSKPNQFSAMLCSTRKSQNMLMQISLLSQVVLRKQKLIEGKLVQSHIQQGPAALSIVHDQYTCTSDTWLDATDATRTVPCPWCNRHTCSASVHTA